ncbi:MAG: hypothetical protein ACRD3T_13680 [Terriglobia bacterium]
MNGEGPSIDWHFRRAFDLLLRMRQHEQSEQILAQLVEYMRTLLRETDGDFPAIIVSVQAIRLRQP